MTQGFLGFVAGGHHPDEVGRLAAEAGHSSATKAHAPAAGIVQRIQAERLVECFEAEIWGGASGLDTLQSVIDAAMAQSLVPKVRLSEVQVAVIRKDLTQAVDTWNTLQPGECLELVFPETRP